MKLKLLSEIKFLKGEEILRRYFVMNSFDGVLTTLGILFGSYISNTLEPSLIVRVVIATGIAMFVSGFFGTYLTESSERKREIKELEKAMVKKFENSTLQKIASKISLISALVDGISPLLASIATIIPFFLGIDPFTSFYISVGIAFGLLFLLGSYLSKISKERIIIGGFKMLLAGVIAALLILLVGGV